MSEPFIPRDYPKSFVTGILAGLGGLLSGGVTFLGIWVEIGVLETLGKLLFFVCWATAVVMLAIFIPRSWAGRYRGLPPRPWKEQVW